MKIGFSEGVVPLSDLKANPGKVVGRTNETHRPILLASLGRGIAVVQGIEDYKKTAEELLFVKAVAKGLTDIRNGNTVSVHEAKKILGSVQVKLVIAPPSLPSPSHNPSAHPAIW